MISIFIKCILFFFEIIISLQLYITKKSSVIPMNLNKNINNSKIINFIRQNEIKRILRKISKNLFHVNSIFITGKAHFGNFLISINNAIIFCELFACKKIIIQKNNNIFINHTIFYPKYNIAIQPNQLIVNENIIILNIWYFFFLDIKSLGDVNRLNILREEILNNLPKLKTHRDDLSMYIRSGDIFIVKNPIISYAQPPLCFYENILNQFKFRHVNIISENDLNPVIPHLKKKYSYIKFKKNDLKYDIAILANSFNIVSAISSFIISIIKLNENIKFLWEYDSFTLRDKYHYLHPLVYSFSYNYIIYKMDASLNYKKFMYPWLNSKEQKQMMLIEKCKENFTIIKSRS